LKLSSEVACPRCCDADGWRHRRRLIYTPSAARDKLHYIRLRSAARRSCRQRAPCQVRGRPLPLYFASSCPAAGSHLFLSYQNFVVTYAPMDRRPVYAGLFNTIAAVISLVSPLIGGTIAQHVGYQALFVVALIMVLGALLVTLRFIHSQHRTEATALAAGD